MPISPVPRSTGMSLSINENAPWVCTIVLVNAQQTHTHTIFKKSFEAYTKLQPSFLTKWCYLAQSGHLKNDLCIFENDKKNINWQNNLKPIRDYMHYWVYTCTNNANPDIMQDLLLEGGHISRLQHQIQKEIKVLWENKLSFREEDRHLRHQTYFWTMIGRLRGIWFHLWITLMPMPRAEAGCTIKEGLTCHF